MPSSRSRSGRALVALVAALTGVGALGTWAEPATAAGPDVVVTGRGFGHGRGLGQWGAFGYAQMGQSAGTILEHFYSNTFPASVSPAAETTVRLLAYDGTPRRVTSATTFSLAGIPIGGGSAGWLTWEDDQWMLNTAPSPGCLSAPVWKTPIYGPPTFQPTYSIPGDDLDAGDDRKSMLAVCDGGDLLTPRYYRGSLRGALDGGSLRLINVVALDAYLRGVVPRESPASWPAAALQAQAVAARSYAVGEARYPYAQTCDTTSCQVYNGAGLGAVSHEHPNTDAAIQATAGGIRRMDSSGAVARTEFSASTGGWTAGGTFPAVIDDGDANPANPNRSWTVTLRGDDVAARYGVGALQSVQVTARTTADGGRRVASVRIVGSAGTVNRTGEQFRADWGLKSTWFDVSTSGPAPPPAQPSTVYLRHATNAGAADITAPYGGGGDTALLCDWNGDGVDTVGIFRNGTWYLRNAPGGGVADVAPFGYGIPGDKPVCGDWNHDLVDTVGVVRGTTWYLRDGVGGGIADVAPFGYGDSGDIPIVGDWDATGTDTAGVYRGGTWYLRNGPGGGVADVGAFGYGNPTDRPVVGDWDGDERDSVGVVRSAIWYLRNGAGGGFADVAPFGYGNPSGDRPLAGDGDGIGGDGPAVARGY